MAASAKRLYASSNLVYSSNLYTLLAQWESKRLITVRHWIVTSKAYHICLVGRMIYTNVCKTFYTGLIPVRDSNLRKKEMKNYIEIRAAEGGEDSKLFVNDLMNAYVKLSIKKG